MAHIVDIQATCRQICRDECQGRTSGKAVERPFAVALFHASVEGADAESFFFQEVCHTLHTLAIVHEDHRGFRTQATEQFAKGLQFILLG